MIKKIPEKAIITCDFCGKEIRVSACNKVPGIRVSQDAFDLYGSSCADASYTRDACYPCLNKINKMLKEFKNDI